VRSARAADAGTVVRKFGIPDAKRSAAI